MKWKTLRRPLPEKRLLGVLAVAVAVLFVLLFVKGPYWIDGAYLREKNLQPADGVIITGLRTAFVALGAGAIAALSLVYTHRNHEQTVKLFEHTREKDREQAEIAREGQVTDRYVEAIKLLSSGNVTQQLGGIYSLERIMRDSEKDHATVVEVLAAFVRQNAPWENVDPGQLEEIRPPDEIQAALTVLGRRPEHPELFIADLARTNLQGAKLMGANLKRVDLTGANLYAARLGGADLKFARLGGADLRRANVYGAELQMAHLAGANLEGADFSAAILERADLSGVLLNETHFEGANLTTAIGLFAGKLAKARIFSTTRMPEGFDRNPNIRKRVKECDESPVLNQPTAYQTSDPHSRT